MHNGHFLRNERQIGKYAAIIVFLLLVVYAVTLTKGLLSLTSQQEPIRDPFFSILEIIILIMAPLMVVLMAAVHSYAAKDVKIYSLTALIFMSLLAGITSSVHFVVLFVSRQIEAISEISMKVFFSFTWPSVIYALDILAWDLFFGLSMIFAAAVFKGGKLEKSIRISMLISGWLSIAGLIGPVANMQLRMIGVVGYVPVFSVVCLLLFRVFSRPK